MRSNSVRDRTIANLRACAAQLVERQRAVTWSRMVAYHNVGIQIGCSADWLRKFIGGYDDRVPDYIIGSNIVSLYNRICLHIERSADRLNEAHQGFNPMGQGMVESPATTPTDAPSLVNEHEDESG